VWDNCNKGLRENRAGRIITHSGYEIRSAEIMETLENVRAPVGYNKALLMFKVVNDAAPVYLVSQFSKRDEVHDHDVRGGKLNLTTPKPDTNFMKSSLAYSGAVVWNSLDVIA
jgi:hypothetical protein